MSVTTIELPPVGQTATLLDTVVVERGQDRRTLLRIVPQSVHGVHVSRRLSELTSERWHEVFPLPIKGGMAVVHLGSGKNECPALRAVVEELLIDVS